MPRLEKSITIAAPLEQVFRYVDEPANLPEVWPSLIEVRDVERAPSGAPRFRYVYKMAGLQFHGTSETVEYIPFERHVLKNTDDRQGGLDATMTWIFAANSENTHLQVEVDYTLPHSLISRLAEPFITRHNEHEMELVLANLKARLEG